eukprot:TRINITY_DN10009_c0_g1_i1.p1 TRINITY_DN10009_c0_g1~~TRINITY_DN10009_c0_g1_i1.p1  ORF type:complete len:1291 (-),score=327.97 TRINITY_DN10009_c0_g1_i1:10-3882(-)
MRVVCQTSQQFPIDVESTDKVRAVKDKIAQKEGIPADGIVLTFNSAVLDDDRCLGDCGLKPNALLVALSIDLAKRRAAECRVRQVQRVFSALTAAAAEDAAAAFEQAQEALRNAPLFPMDCSPLDLAELGPGIPLFLDFVKCLALVMAVVFLAQALAVSEYAAADGLERWPAASEEKGVSQTARLSPGSLGPEGSTSGVPMGNAALSCLCLFAAALLYLPRQQRISSALDEMTTHPDDFAVLVAGLPADAKDELEIKHFFEQSALPPGSSGSDEKVDVVQVVLGYDVGPFLEITKARQQVGQDLAAAEPGSEEEKAAKQRIAELNKIMMSEKGIRAEVPFTGKCVVVLRSQRQHRKVLKEWDTGRMQMCVTLDLLGADWLVNLLYRWPLFRNEHKVYVVRAPSSSDIMWPNFGVPAEEKRQAMMKTLGAIGAMLLVSFGIIFGMKQLQKAVPALAFITVLSILAMNVAIEISVRILVFKEKHSTKTRRDVSVMILMTVAMVMNNAIVLIPLYPDPDSWYRDGGLCYTVTSLEVIGAVFMPLVIFLNPAKLIKNYKTSKLDIVSAEPRPTQAELNRTFEPKEMDMPKAYAKVFRCFLISAIFTPLFPFCAAITAIEMVALYWAFKRMLLRDSKRPYAQSDDLAVAAGRFLYAACMGLAFAALLFLPPSLAGDAKTTSRAVTVALAMLSLGAAVVPLDAWRGFWQLLFGCVSGDEEQDFDAFTDSYYNAQTLWPKEMKYHTGQPVYMHIERIWRIYKDRGLPYKEPLGWDADTGNVLAPDEETVPPTESTKTTASEPPPTPSGSSPMDAAAEEIARRATMKEDAAATGLDGAAEDHRDPAAVALEKMKLAVPVAADEAEAGKGEDSMKAVTSLKRASAALVGDGDSADWVFVGQTLVVVGLTAAPQWNGTRCKVLKLDEMSGKWLVKLQSGAQARLSLENLAPTQLLLKNIVKQPELNGSEVEVLGWDAKLEKWIVQLPNGSKARLAQENLDVPTGASKDTAARAKASSKTPKKKLSRKDLSGVSTAEGGTGGGAGPEDAVPTASIKEWPATRLDSMTEEIKVSPDGGAGPEDAVPTASIKEWPATRLDSMTEEIKVSPDGEDAEETPASPEPEPAAPSPPEVAGEAADEAGVTIEEPPAATDSGIASPSEAPETAPIACEEATPPPVPSQMSGESSTEGLRPGDGLSANASAIVVSLAAKPEFNGTQCTLLDLDEATSKWRVKLEGGQEARLLPQYLAASRVVLRNIVKQPDLNGVEVVVKGWDENAGKWIVELPKGGKAQLLPTNVELVC